MHIDQHQPVDLAKRMVRLILQNQRMQCANECRHDDVIDCVKVHVEKVLGLIKENKKIQFILPAFPAKSANSDKTFGPLPDLGELLALKQLHFLCDQVKSFYPPGAEMIICSDGRVFNDLVLVSNNNVERYTQALKAMIKSNHLSNIHFFDLDDHYPRIDYQVMRDSLESDYAEPLENIKANVKMDDTVKSLFSGIHRFVYEDYLTIMNHLTKNKIRHLSKEIAYKVIQRSNAWGKLVADKYPDGIRLSIHPQQCGSAKLGIMLVKSENIWATPWHRVVIQQNNTFSLIKRSDAEKIGALPVYKNNQFSHYNMMETKT